jgi:hypothetical protein
MRTAITAEVDVAVATIVAVSSCAITAIVMITTAVIAGIAGIAVTSTCA